MAVIDALKAKAIANKRRVLYPEACDPTILAAAVRVLDEGIAMPVLIGDPSAIRATEHYDERLPIIDAADTDRARRYASAYEQEEGFAASLVEPMLKAPLNIAAAAVRNNEADALVVGRDSKSQDVVMSAQMFIGSDLNARTPCGLYLLEIPGFSGGEAGSLIFADAVVQPNPGSEQIADIALVTAATARALLGWQPRVALLSFSTKGSALNEQVNKVLLAESILRQRDPALLIEGELQADVALTPEAAQRESVQKSPVAGKANVLVFPNLDAANAGYHLVHTLAKARSLGPLYQGFRRPVAGIPRAATVEDVITSTILVCCTMYAL